MFRWKYEEGQWRGVDGEFAYRIDHNGEVETNASEADLARFLRMDWNQAECQAALLAADPQLEAIVAKMPGLRLLRPSSVTEVLFGFLCSANNHLPRILAMNAALAAHGSELEFGLRRFPTTEVIAGIDEATLRAKGFGYRAATIPRAAREVMARGGDAYLSSLRDRKYEDLTLELQSIPNIGPKLADCIALFGLDKTEAVPVDTHIWHAAVERYFPQWKGQSLTHNRYRAIGDALRDRFGSLAGFAQQYIFYDRLIQGLRNGQNLHG